MNTESTPSVTPGRAIVLFDGVCNLCSASVRFIVKRDRSAYFGFAALQSREGRELLAKYRLPPDEITTIVSPGLFWQPCFERFRAEFAMPFMILSPESDMNGSAGRRAVICHRVDDELKKQSGDTPNAQHKTDDCVATEHQKGADPMEIHVAPATCTRSTGRQSTSETGNSGWWGILPGGSETQG